MLSLLYTADILLIAARHGVSAHSYADTQLMYTGTLMTGRNPAPSSV